MAHSFPNRLSVVLATSAAASALIAAPALATEGPAAPPPAPTLPSGVAPVTFTPVPAPTLRNQARLINRARLAHRRVQRGRRGLLRISLAQPSRLRIVLSRTRSNGRRIRVASLRVPARGRNVSVRLPARTHGHLLRPDRYRVSVTAIDGSGARSRPVNLTMIVRR